MVVMVHGSGALDRDESVAANKPFRDIAEGLARYGIGSLRYDKRTYVYPHSAVTSLDEETILDALSAIALARRYGSRIVVLGHSLGATVAPIIAERADTLLSGIVMLAAAARPMEEVVSEQIAYLLPSGADESYKAHQLEALRLRSPHYFEPIGQLEAAQRLHVPLLLLQGERDYQVTMRDFDIWRQALANTPGATLISYPTLNHLFMAGTGKSSPIEYRQPGHVADRPIADIAAFIASLPR